jgi:hypothetical protein
VCLLNMVVHPVLAGGHGRYSDGVASRAHASDATASSGGRCSARALPHHIRGTSGELRPTAATGDRVGFKLNPLRFMPGFFFPIKSVHRQAHMPCSP